MRDPRPESEKGDEEQLLPMLVAHVDEAGRAFVESVAEKEGGAYLVLESPPITTGLHALEVHSTGSPEPLLLMAEPLGPVNERGCPLRLRFPSSAPPGLSTPTAASNAKQSGEHSRVTQVEDEEGAWPAPATNVRMRRPPELEDQQHVAAPADPFVGRALAGGKLLIEECVGTGGVGTVYRAQHRTLMMAVAVKVMHASYQNDATFSSRFHAEALNASKLDHKNLTRVLDFGQEPDGLLYLAMEFLDGRSLRDILYADKTLDVPRTAQIIMQVCSALTHAHSRGIVHRDIKPENLVITRGLDDDGNEIEIVKVCDFGIAHAATGATVVHAGTAEYMSPELMRGELPNAQSDVYACGVVLYELLTGRVPIEGELPAIAHAVLTVMPELPSTLNPAIDARIDRVVMKALEKDPAQRYASARELRAELKSVVESVAAFGGTFMSGGYWDEIDSGPVSQAPAAVQAQAQAARRSSAPPAKSSSPPAKAPEDDWLEHSPSYFSTPPATGPSPTTTITATITATAGTSVGPPPSHPGATSPSLPPGSEEAKAVAPFLRQLAETTDPVKFGVLVAPLSQQIRALLEQGSTAAAWRLCSTLEMIARNEVGGRAEHAKTVLQLFNDPQLLLPVADHALDRLRDKDGSAMKLVVRAENGGAHALYSARVRNQSAGYEVRERFTAALRQIGPAGLPTIRDALGLLESRLGVLGAMSIVEDLLKALHEIPAMDDALGTIVARYAQSTSKNIALLAVNALPRIWKEKARPILLLRLHHPDDTIAIAAMKHLRTQGGIDAQAIETLRPIILGTTTAHTPVRVAAIAVMAHALPDARRDAGNLLVEIFRALSGGTTPDVEELVVTLAGVLMKFGGKELVTERYRTAVGQLRIRLEAVLRNET